jgi:ABC-type glycerol-3-phosphate transport system substrate-binding protein
VLRNGFRARVAGAGLVFAVLGALAVVPSQAVLGKTTIRWWMGNAGGIAVWQNLAKEYEKQNPKIDIVLVQGELDKFYTMATAGLMPDLWGPWSNAGIRADVNRNWATELTPYIQRDGKAMDISDFFPGLMREFRVNGKQYSLPIFNYQDCFFYNTELYAQAGLVPPPLDSNDKSWTWDRMVLNAKKMTKIGNTGKITVAGVDFKRDLTWNPGYLSIWGAHPYSETALKSSVPQEVNWDSKEMLTGFTKAQDLIYKEHVANATEGGFETGKVGQRITVGWNIGDYIQAKKLKWAIVNNPWGVSNQGAMWPDGWRMSKVSKNKEQVWSFIKYLCSPKVMAEIVSDPKGPFKASAVARKSVFNETLAENIGAATGMKPSDVLRVTDQADEVNVVKFQETICLHMDLMKFLEPSMTDLWSNKISAQQFVNKLQSATNARLPELFKRWLRNVKFTGADA